MTVANPGEKLVQPSLNGEILAWISDGHVDPAAILWFPLTLSCGLSQRLILTMKHHAPQAHHSV